MRTTFFSIFVLCNSFTLSAQNSNPLQPFEYLIGGEWTTQTTVQIFEWGVGNKSVYSRLYVKNGSDTTLSGEITWFWHPGEKQIKGYGHLVSNQLSFFDYTSTFTHPTRMDNIVLGYNNTPVSVPIFESIEFIDENTYRWTMYENVLNDLKPLMNLDFKRKN